MSPADSAASCSAGTRRGGSGPITRDLLRRGPYSDLALNQQITAFGRLPVMVLATTEDRFLVPLILTTAMLFT